MYKKKRNFLAISNRIIILLAKSAFIKSLVIGIYMYLKYFGGKGGMVRACKQNLQAIYTYLKF